MPRARKSPPPRPRPRSGFLIAAALLPLAGLLAAFLAYRGASGPQPSPAASPAPPPATRSDARPDRAEGPPDALADVGGPERSQAEIVAYLQERYGARIAHPYIQIKVLEDLIRYFRKRHPDRWRDEVLEVLRLAFPDRYAELAAHLQHWLDYEKWMADSRSYLQGLGEKERRAALWDIRNKLFGKEAAERIWASELKNQAVADALRAIDAQPDARIPDRLSMYKERIEDVYQEKTEAYLERHRQEVLNHFLDLESVQRELSAMTPEQRARSLREIRQGLGLAEEALKRWEILDHERDARWADGARYVKERQALAKQYAGAELEEKLKDLRLRYFGGEADTIAQEEQSGFFRFDRPRRWGRN